MGGPTRYTVGNILFRSTCYDGVEFDINIYAKQAKFVWNLLIMCPAYYIQDRLYFMLWFVIDSQD